VAQCCHAAVKPEHGPCAICRGTFNVNATEAPKGIDGHLADTFVSVRGWGKGLLWVNGFNLGWYWPSIGPQEAHYIPGPLLRKGENEIVLLEVEATPSDATGASVSPQTPMQRACVHFVALLILKSDACFLRDFAVIFPMRRIRLCMLTSMLIYFLFSNVCRLLTNPAVCLLSTRAGSLSGPSSSAPLSGFQIKGDVMSSISPCQGSSIHLVAMPSGGLTAWLCTQCG
jgi:hypothetical protein